MIRENLEILKIAISAFGGAFAAFVFFRFGEFINRIVKKRNDYLTALVKIERIMNENYDLLNGNVYNIERIKDQYEKARKNNLIVFSSNHLSKLALDDQILLDVNNIDYYNDLFSYKTKIRRFNGDIDSIDEIFKFIKDGYFSDKIDLSAYFMNYENVINKLNDINKFIISFMDETKELIAKSRVLSKIDKSIFHKIILFFIKKNYSKSFHEKLSAEKEKVSSEIEKMKKHNKEKIDLIFNKE